MQLLLDPFFQADLANLVYVSGTRAVSQAIHRVQNGFVFSEFRNRELAFEFLVEHDALVGGAGVHAGLAFGLAVTGGAQTWHRRGEGQSQQATKQRSAWCVQTVAALKDSLFLHLSSLGAHDARRNTNLSRSNQFNPVIAQKL